MTRLSGGSSSTFRRLLAGCYSAMGDIQLWDGDAKASFESYSQAFGIARLLAEADPKSQQAQFDLVATNQGLGYAEVRLGRLHEARRNLEAAVKVSETVAAADPQSASAKDVLAYSENGLGNLYEQSAAPALAVASYRKALNLWKQLVAEAPQDIDTRLKVASIEDRIGDVLANTGPTGEAISAYREALSSAEDLTKSTPTNQWALYVVADALSGLGDVAARLAEKQQISSESLKEWTKAQTWYQRSADTWRQVHNPGVMNPGTFECGSPAHVSEGLGRCDSSLRKIRTLGSAH